MHQRGEQVGRSGQATDTRPKVTPALLRSALSIARSLAGTEVFGGGVWEALRSPLPRAAVETFLDIFSTPQLTWKDLAELREWTSLPIVLKGVLHPDDAAQAVDHGVDGVWVSNHGGRQIDGSVGALGALPSVVERIQQHVPVIFDSGIRGCGRVQGAGDGRNSGRDRTPVRLRACAVRRVWGPGRGASSHR